MNANDLLARLEAVERRRTPVVARYFITNTTTIANNTQTRLNFNYRNYDTHNIVTTGASWLVRAPVTGFMQIHASIMFDLYDSWSPTKFIYMRVVKNDTASVGLFHRNDVNASTKNIYVQADGLARISVNAGDELYVMVQQLSGGSRNLLNDVNWNYIEIAMV